MNVAGPSLPMPLFGHSMVPLGLGQAILGGAIARDVYSDGINKFPLDVEFERKIHFLSCLQLRCHIITLNQELNVPRGYFMAIPIPDSISGCISKSKFLVLKVS